MVSTAITSIDLHDIARSALTYGLSDLFVTHPVAAQRELAMRVRRHWVDGAGARRIPDRKPALELVRVVESLEDAIGDLGGDVEVWTTSARAGEGTLGYPAARRALETEGRPVLICFGTGWGLAPAVIDGASRRLEPITGRHVDGYNHLSVRAAAAITFDRLRGAS